MKFITDILYDILTFMTSQDVVQYCLALCDTTILDMYYYIRYNKTIVFTNINSFIMHMTVNNTDILCGSEKYVGYRHLIKLSVAHNDINMFNYFNQFKPTDEVINIKPNTLKMYIAINMSNKYDYYINNCHTLDIVKRICGHYNESYTIEQYINNIPSDMLLKVITRHIYNHQTVNATMINLDEILSIITQRLIVKSLMDMNIEAYKLLLSVYIIDIHEYYILHLVSFTKEQLKFIYDHEIISSRVMYYLFYTDDNDMYDYIIELTNSRHLVNTKDCLYLYSKYNGPLTNDQYMEYISKLTLSNIINCDILIIYLSNYIYTEPINNLQELIDINIKYNISSIISSIIVCIINSRVPETIKLLDILIKFKITNVALLTVLMEHFKLLASNNQCYYLSHILLKHSINNH